MRKIIFVGDVLRCQDDSAFPATRDIMRLYYLFSEQIRAACDLEIDVVVAENTSFFNRDYFYKLSGYKEVNQKNWLSIVCGQYSDQSANYFADCFKDCFLIFQEAGALKQVADEKNIPYIDTYISAIRFLPDLHYAMRTNVPEIRNLLKKHIVEEEYKYLHASAIKGMYWSSAKKLNIEENSLLFCGQTDIDLSIIKNNKTVTFEDFKDKLKNLFSQYNKVYFKKHPSGSQETTKSFLTAFKNVKLINEVNFYKILANDNITAVAALSSGSLLEAPYFRKNVHIISDMHVTYYKDGSEISHDDYMTITDEYFNPSFWNDVLAPVIPTNGTKISFQRPQWNYIRTINNMWWGYNINKVEQYSKKSIVNSVEKSIVSKFALQPKETVKFKSLRHILALFCPLKRLRHKIRGK